MVYVCLTNPCTWSFVLSARPPFCFTFDLAFLTVTQMIIQELLHYAVLEDTRIVHLFTELIILVCVSNMLFWR